jgi:hypothetical protein
MTLSITPCLNQHLIDKAKTGNVVPASAWLDSAKANFKSASSLLNDHPAGAVQLAWSAMHDLAKSLAAEAGYRLDDETHGKVADFLICSYGDDLTNTELGLIRTIQMNRNRSNYQDPRVPQGPVIGAAVNLTRKMIDIADPVITPNAAP